MKKNSIKTELSQGTNKIIYLDQIRWRKAGQLLRRKLGEFADRAAFFDEAARAQEVYLNSIAPGYGDSEDDFTMERCFEWFIFDYVMAAGHTLIEDFKVSQTFSEMEKQLLEHWSAARISVYDVIHVYPGKYMVIKDLMRRNEYTVQDPSVAKLVEPGTVLLMRVLKVGDEYEFSTSGLALPGFCRQLLMKNLHDDFSRYCSRKGKTQQEAWQLYLKERSHMINGWVMEIGINASLPHPVNTAKAPSGAVIRNISDKRIKEKVTGDVAKKITDDSQDELKDDALTLEWLQPTHRRVAGSVSEYLGKMGYDRKQVEGAIRLWHDYCRLKNPNPRKESVWTATVAYAMGRMEFNGAVSQQELAHYFGVSASTISGNFRTICDALGLMAYDQRYSTQKSPLEGLLDSNPLLVGILDNLKL
jgi:hypothetical protein